VPIVFDYDGQGNPSEGRGYRTELDYTGGPGSDPVYVGWAAPGSDTDAAVWKILKLTYSGTNLTQRLWADGDTKFDNVWDQRATLSYS
jgi:hypothetical protein